MVDLASAGKAGGELDLIPPPTPTIPHIVKPELLIPPNYCITSGHGTGTISRRTQLLANHFKVIVKAPDAVLYQYFVHITAEDKRTVKGKGIGRVLSRLFQTYSSELAGKKFAYDGEKALYTVDHLPQNKHQFTVVLEETFAKSENVSASEGTKKHRLNRLQSKSFTVELSYAASVPLQSIALEGANVNNTRDALRVLHVILQQQAANMNFTDVGAGVIGVQGFHSSFLPAQDFLIANQSVQEPRYIDWMSDHLGHGTTIGVFKFKHGVAAFVDSRTTFQCENNKVYFGGGIVKGNKLLVHLFKLCVEKEEKATKNFVTIERAVQLMLEAQDAYLIEDPKNETIFGGILIGCQATRVYQAYVVELFKTHPFNPRCLAGDVQYLLYGSGSTFAKPKLHSLINPQMSREMATSVISETMLETTLKSYHSGGPIDAFFFYDGEEMYDLEKNEPQHRQTLQPLEIHLQNHEFSCNRILFLVVHKSVAGPYAELEEDLARRPGVVCASTVAQTKSYLVYRILFQTAEEAETAYGALTANRITEPEPVSGFECVPFSVADRSCSCLIARCSEALLQLLVSSMAR